MNNIKEFIKNHTKLAITVGCCCMALILTTVGVFAMSSCKGDDNKSSEEISTSTETKSEAKVTYLSDTDVTLSRGDIKELVLNNGKVKEWKSSNSEVATVSSKGMVTALIDGDCVITAIDNDDKSYTCKIKIITEELSSAELKMSPGQEYQLSVKNSVGTVEWSTENEEIATVSDSGNVTAVSNGTTSITASVDKKNLECIVTVEEGVTEVESVAPVDSKNEKASSASKGEIVPAGNVENTSNSSSGSSSSSGQKAPSNSSSTAAQAGETLPSGNNSGNSGDNGTSSGSTSGSSSSSSSETTKPSTETTKPSQTQCSHSWDAGTVTKDATCTEKGVKTYTCTKCGKTKTEDIACTAHSYGWVRTKEPTVTEEGLEEYKCSVCGHVNGTQSVAKLPNPGKETSWSYSGNTRTKTMYDGTVITETKVDTDEGSVWGWYDDSAASQMFSEIQNMQSQAYGAENVAVWDNDEVSWARAEVAYYAACGSSSKAFHMNSGGLPNVSDNRKYITFKNSQGCGMSLSCFVVDCVANDTCTYGECWESYFGTYYSSAF